MLVHEPCGVNSEHPQLERPGLCTMRGVWHRSVHTCFFDSGCREGRLQSTDTLLNVNSEVLGVT